MKYFLFIVVFFTLLYNGVLWYVDAHIDQKDHRDVYNDCHKVWSSRGVYSSHATQNSLESFEKAFALGHKGVEVDFYYDVQDDIFVISHNRPKKDTNGKLHYTLKDGKILTLQELLEKTGAKHYFWLDYRNLDRLSTQETLKAIKRLDTITQGSDIKERLYLEGSTPNTLDIYTKAGYKTLFAFQPLKADSFFSSISSNIYKIAYYFYDITAIAMPYGPLDNPKYSQQTQENLQGIPLFLFHVPEDRELLKKLASKSDLRVMLVGRDKSVNYADITNCKKEN
jgi:hypothetical protein